MQPRLPEVPPPPLVSPSTPAPAGPSTSTASVDQVIDKLRRTAARPNEKYIACLQGYAEVDATEWGAAFPIGYRERVAPSWLGEIYSGGKTGKAFAKDFVRDRQLSDSSEARELISVMAAIDAMVLEDCTPGVINSVALERLAKRGFGIHSAFRLVERKEDWRKPPNAGKQWRSKVDDEMWRRIDPARANVDELSFVNRRVEEEIRGEVERDAAILKSFAKLRERQGTGADSA